MGSLRLTALAAVLLLAVVTRVQAQQVTPDTVFVSVAVDQERITVGDPLAYTVTVVSPSGVAVDSDGDVYVTDWGNHRVQIYDSNGAYITALLGDAQEPSNWAQTYIDANPDIVKARRRANLEPEWRFRRPVAVNVDVDDRIIILESYRHRLQIYNKVRDYEEHSLNL